MSDETTVIAASKPKRKYTEPTKSDYIIRCMAAENTVRAQDAELNTQRQARENAESAARNLADENIRLRARASTLTNGASLLAVIATVLAFALLSFLIGGAR